ncbi:MAG: hypothetical protein RRB13_09930 [bacterium]|nr:hypothetical protein [bacterium]
MFKRNHLALTAIFLWVLTLVVFGYFVYFGTLTGEVEGGRKVIQVTASELAFIQERMIFSLKQIAQIQAALAVEDLKAIVEPARSLGRGNGVEAPKSLPLKMPFDFRRLIVTNQEIFSGMAEKSAQGAFPSELQEDLTRVLKNCHECHAKFKVVAGE